MSIAVCPKCGAKNRVEDRAENLQPVCGRCGEKLEASAGEATEGASTGGHPVTVTDASFAKDVLQSGKTPVLVDCWAPWCGPCRMIAPTLDQMAAEAGGRYVIAKLNTDENPQTASQYQISAIPTLLLFKDGQLVDRIVGLAPREKIERKLMSLA